MSFSSKRANAIQVGLYLIVVREHGAELYEPGTVSLNE